MNVLHIDYQTIEINAQIVNVIDSVPLQHDMYICDKRCCNDTYIIIIVRRHTVKIKYFPIQQVHVDHHRLKKTFCILIKTSRKLPA